MTAHGSRLPNFLIIGAMKAGTTSLYRYLRSHPDVFMPAQKEPHFFNRSGWSQQLDWYTSLFRHAGNAVAIGEASTNYTKHPNIPNVPERIAKIVPDARLVYVVRNPVERARSHYLHELLRGKVRMPIDRALLEENRFVDWGRYAMQIEQYLPYFPREQLLVVRSEDLMRRKADVIAQVYRFVGVDPSFVPPNLDRNFHRTEARREPRPWFRRVRRTRAYRRVRPLVPSVAAEQAARVLDAILNWSVDRRRGEISGGVRRAIEADLADDVRRLRAYLGEDFDGWGIA